MMKKRYCEIAGKPFLKNIKLSPTLKLTQKKNRLLLSIAMINSKQKLLDNNFRKGQTRTKIQLGGLLLKSGLTDILDIKQGDDLQLDFAKKDKAYILLGILADASENIKSENSFSYFLSKGKNIANS